MFNRNKWFLYLICCCNMFAASILFDPVDKITKAVVEWCCTRNRRGSEMSVFSAMSKTKFQPKYHKCLWATSFKWTTCLFAPLLLLVHRVLCAGHQNTTQTCKVSFKIRKVPEHCLLWSLPHHKNRALKVDNNNNFINKSSSRKCFTKK